MKILAIGNSFSQNAMAYLERMAAAGKQNFVLGNLVIGGCSLERHCGNMESDAPEYDFEIRSLGGKVTLQNHKMRHALKSDDWDVVTLQQVSGLGGRPDSFEPYLEKLINYVKECQPNAEILLHETWSYEITTEHGSFLYYDRDQLKMYKAIHEHYKAFSKKYGLRVIPCGTAFQIARTMDIFDVANGGKSLCRADDGFHASETHGQYLAGAVWYEMLSGESILENPYSVDGISFYELMSLKKAAHLAVQNGEMQPL